LFGLYLSKYYYHLQYLTKFKCLLFQDLKTGFNFKEVQFKEAPQKSIDRSFLKAGSDLLEDEEVQYAVFNIIVTLLKPSNIIGKLLPTVKDDTYILMVQLMKKMYTAFPKDIYRVKIENPPNNYEEILIKIFEDSINKYLDEDSFLHWFKSGAYNLFSKKDFSFDNVKAVYYNFMGFIEVQVILTGAFDSHKIYELNRLEADIKKIRPGLKTHKYDIMLEFLIANAIMSINSGDH